MRNQAIDDGIRGDMAAGVMQSEYLCKPELWDAFQKLIQNAPLHIFRQEGDFETGWLYVFRSMKADRNLLMLSTWPQKAGENKENIKVDFNWYIENTNESREMAAQVEKLLLGIGAVCIRCPVSKE